MVVTLDFFDDIQIPASYLQYPAKFNEEEQVWIWEYDNEEKKQKHELYMDVGTYAKHVLAFHEATSKQVP